ncbi:MAG: VOC family protein [Actinobacteria bacterium]|nr:VOC family protein [Actinomycetota bacterium]
MSTSPRRQQPTPRFDHLMHWVPDLDAAAVAYQQAGFPLRINPPRPDTGVRNGGWWKDLHYVETLAIVDAELTRSSQAYGSFTQQILPLVEETVATGGGALNFAVLVDDVNTAVAAMCQAGIPARQHTVRMRLGPLTLPVYTIGWPTDGPPWAPFVITYHPLVRGIQKRLLPFLRHRQPAFDMHQLLIEVPDPAASATWLAAALNLPTPHQQPTVPLGGCDALFIPGPANRITTLVLTGPGAPDTVIAGLHYQPRHTTLAQINTRQWQMSSQPQSAGDHSDNAH